MMQSKKTKIKYANFKQGSMSMREFVTKDDRMARQLKQAGGKISDQTRIELVDNKISSAAREAMERYTDIKVALGGLDEDMHNDWLKYSDVLLQVCAETDSDSGDGSSDEEGGDRPAATKKLSVPGKRQLARDDVVAIRGYAEYHGKSFSDVSL